MKNILVYIETRTVIEPIAQFTIKLAQVYDARIFALAVIKQHKTYVKSRTDEQAWKRLYEIEEDAFEADVKISLLLEELDDLNRTAITNKIISIVQNFSIGMLILCSNAKINIKEIMSGLNTPIIIYPPDIRKI